MFNQRWFILVGLVMALILVAACAPVTPPPAPEQPSGEEPAAQPEEPAEEAMGKPSEIKMGIITFLSGGAASSFGEPSQNAADALIEAINAGEAPAPYDTPGIGGVPMSAIYIDEAGGAEKQVAEYRRLVVDEGVDLVIGYVSSSDCLAAAPVADELETLTIFYDCGVPRLFEEAEYKYAFRTNAHAIIDSIGAARYILSQKPDVETVAGINQNYSWGQESWETFRDSILQLKPEVEIVSEQFPQYGAGEYSAEISALQSAAPEVIHSSLWGADMESFVIQSAARGLPEQSMIVFPVGEPLLPLLGEDMPEGVVIGAHGPHGPLAPDNELNKWFVDIYESRAGVKPVYPAYHMSQAILGVKMAYETAMADNGGEWPTADQVAAALEYAEFDTPSGVIRMSIGNGHQAVESAPFAEVAGFNSETGEVELTNIESFQADCVNPPDGVASTEWIADGFPGATCP